MTAASFAPGEAPGVAFDPEDALGRILRVLDEATGPELLSVIHFGSRVSGASPGSKSAFDLCAVVRSYPEFYRRFRRAIPGSPGAGWLARLNRVMPPNILFVPSPGTGPGAKLFVVSEKHFARDLSRRARDHFFRGRMMQRVEIAFARDEERARAVQDLLDSNRRDTLDWMHPFLEGSFTAEEYGRHLLAVSYGQEVRPEDASRREEVFEAQRGFFGEVYGAMLAGEAARGRLETTDDTYRFAIPASRGHRLRVRAYFFGSKVRATLRWLKYVLTFDDWGDYIAAKIERRTGEKVELRERERRYPFLFLWPKLLGFLRRPK